MSAYKLKKILLGLLGSLILGGILATAGDFALTWLGKGLSCSLYLLAILVLTLVLLTLFRKKPVNALKTAVWTLALLLLLGSAAFLSWAYFARNAGFDKVDQGKNQLYAGRKVMVIVPHEDDEINVLGGIMEEFVRYGSELYPVFVTNGDKESIPEIRFREVLEVMEWVGGVPEENVTFLGYGDTWKEDGPHLYNAESGVVLESAAGYTATYGTAVHAAYREGRDYTVDHLLEDMRDVILEHRPDVIFCSDYDLHIDHRATTLAFEKVMGRILKENPDYRPQVFKGYAYSTAWYAPADFYQENLLSTQNPFAEPYRQSPAVYRWEERVRLPLQDGSLSRSLVGMPLYDTMLRYHSQRAGSQAARVINGDKVFWYRDTNSLCYSASIRVSSGDGAKLTDFMLLENLNLVDPQHPPTDGCWIPTDREKSVRVTFPEPVDIAQLRLYDNPSPEDNVLAGVIRFPDDTEVPFGPLDPQGAAVTIPVEKSQIIGFELYLTETEGEQAGLAELEAFREPPEHGLRYVKLMDSRENFLYDYWVPESSKDTLLVYTAGLRGEELDSLTLSWDNVKCWAQLKDGRISVICPKGERMNLTLRLEGTDISDTVRIGNPKKTVRLYTALSQTLEEQFYLQYWSGNYRLSALYKLLATALGR